MIRQTARVTRYFYLHLACICLTVVAPAAAAPTNEFLNFDEADFVQIADSDALDLSSGPFTISAWIRPTGWGDGDQGRIVDHGGGSSGGSGWTFQVENKTASRALRFRVNNDGNALAITPDDTLTLNVWQHVVATFDGSTLRLFIDGIERGNAQTFPSPLPRADTVHIGARSSESVRGFAGDIDDVQIWGRALTVAEIFSGMATELSGAEPDLVAYYAFNEQTGQIAVDASPLVNDGILGSTIGVDSEDPDWQPISPPQNMAPTIDVGPDLAIALPDDRVVLQALVDDDQLPTPFTDLQWSVVGSPAPASIADPASAVTTAVFAAPGVYTLRATVSDGELNASDDVQVTVHTSAILTEVDIRPNPATTPVGGAVQLYAIGRDQTGRRYPIDPVWATSGGSISSDGIFQAGMSAGSYQVTVSSGGVVGTADVIVGAASAAWPTSGWDPVSTQDAGMDAALLDAAREYALTGGGSGFITRSGRLAMSWGDPTQLYEIKSSTKSVGGLILGIGLQDALVSLTDNAQTLLPELGQLPVENQQTGWLDDISILHLATHTAGFDKPGGEELLLFEPGTVWAYSDGGTNWLADVLTVTFQSDLRTILRDRILTPLGIPIDDLTWRNNNYRSSTLQGFTRREFGSGISTTVDVMAKLGYLALRGGEWDGVPIMPSAYIDQLRTIVPGVAGLPVDNDINQQYANAPDHYGILWWNNADGSLAGVPTDTFWSWGLRDSLIVVIPSLDIVATRTGVSWPGDRSPSYYEVLQPFIEPIARSVLSHGNQQPAVDAGNDGIVGAPLVPLALRPTVSDDGLPSESLQFLWETEAGPGSATFADPQSADTDATFPLPGVYWLRLSVDDGELQHADIVSVVVLDGTGPDMDGDGIPDAADNCVATANGPAILDPGDAGIPQRNTDGDAQGDACDADDDNDGLPDISEALIGTDRLDTDSDDDGVSDVSDQFPLDPLQAGFPGDLNGDGVLNGSDLILMERALLGFVSLDSAQFWRVDLHPAGGNAWLDVADLSALRKKLLEQ